MVTLQAASALLDRFMVFPFAIEISATSVRNLEGCFNVFAAASALLVDSLGNLINGKTRWQLTGREFDEGLQPHNNGIRR
jgi:hypothetical protein